MNPANAHVHVVAASAGFVAYVILWLAVLWGTTLKLGWGVTRVRHSTLYGTHYFLTLVGLVLSVVHALGQLAVEHGPVGWLGEWVPFVTSSKAFGIGLGVISLELMLALALSVLIQRRLGYNRWRGLHSTAYIAFTLVGAHILLAGSDVGPIYFWLPTVILWATTILFRIATSRFFAALPRKLSEMSGRRTRPDRITVQVDPVHCARYGFCEHEAPDVFQLRGDGRLTYRRSVPASHGDAVIRAANACPARAIVLDRLATAAVLPTATAEVGPATSMRNGTRARSERQW